MDEGRVERLEARLREFEARLAALEASPEGPVPGDMAQQTTAARTSAPPPPPPSASSSPPPPPSRLGVPAAGAPQLGQWPSLAARDQPLPTPQPLAASAPAAPAWGAAPGTSPQARARPSLRELEERFAGRALAWAGGLALVAASIFFLSLAFSRGWINEPLRVLIGLAAGCAALVAGGVFLDRRNALMGNVLSAVGLGVISVSLFAATRLYGLIPPELGLFAALVTVIAAAALAIRFDAREVAAFGLVTALIAPPLVGAPPTALTLAFIAVTLIGTTAIAIFRSWRWLPVIAFALAAPQLATWLNADPNVGEGLVVLVGFWLVTAIAAAGEEVRIRRDDLRPSSALLVLADAAFLVWGGFVLLSGDLAPWRGAFVVAAALAHLALGGWFLRRQGLEHLYGNLVAATGVGLVTLAAFVQLGAAVVPVAWAAEAVALTWLAVRRRHRWSADGALALGGLVVLHLLTVEFPPVPGWPFASASNAGVAGSFAAVSLAAVLVAAALAAVIVPSRLVRSTIGGIGILLVAWAIPFVLESPTVIAAWVLLLPIGVVIDAALVRTAEDPAISRLLPLRLPIQPASVAGAIGWSVAALYAFAGALSPADWGSVHPSVTPFRDERTLIAVLLAGSAIAAATWTLVPAFRRLSIVAAFAVVAAVIPFEVYADWVAVLWVGLAALAILVARRDQGGSVVFTWLAAGLMGASVVVAWGIVAPPHDLVVSAGRAPLLPAWPVAFGAIALGLWASPRHRPLSPWTTWLQLGAAVTVVYAISIAVVNVFQQMVGGSTAVEELAKQAQVALSVCWTAIGVLALIVGMVRRHTIVRQAGLALIGLATAKVFLIDLASMDVAYRALVLAGLGVMLLLSAWLFTRFRAPRDTPAGAPPPGD